MANEHIKTAANNLERAISDLNLQIQGIKNNIDESKRKAAAEIRKTRVNIAQLEKKRLQPNVDAPAKIAVEIQIKNLQLDIAKIQKQIDEYAHKLESQISGLNGEIREFESLVSHLNALA